MERRRRPLPPPRSEGAEAEGAAQGDRAQAPRGRPAHLACDHPCFPGFRSLISTIEVRHPVVVDRSLDEDTTRPVYRVAVPWEDRTTKKPLSWDVFVVEPSSPLPIREHLVYFPEARKLPEGRAPVPAGFELPESYGARFLHLRKVFRDSLQVQGVSLPRTWEVTAPAGKLRATVEIDADSVASPIEPRHGYKVAVPPGSYLIDLERRMTFIMDPEGKELVLEADSGGPSEGDLDTLLAEAGVAAQAAAGKLKEIRSPSGCSANTVYLALAALGRPRSLPEILQGLGIKPGDESASLQVVSKYLQSLRLEALAIEGDMQVIRDAANAPAILHRESSADEGHFFAVRDYRSDDDTVQVLDPPNGFYREPVSTLARYWSGVALVVDPEAVEKCRERVRGANRKRMLLVAGISAAAVILLALGLRPWRRWRSPRTRAGRAAVISVAAILLEVPAGCASDSGGTGQVAVVGDDAVDFGTIKDPSTALVHTFVIENRSGRTQRILEIKKTCGCLAAESSGVEMRPGAQTQVTVSLDGKYVVGKRSTAAFVVFEDAAVKPVRVRLTAFVDPEYRVVVQPRYLTIPKGSAAGLQIEGEIAVTEFTTSLGEYELETAVESRSPDVLQVVSVAPWRSIGWRYTGGYSRETTIRVRYSVPKEWSGGNLKPVPLVFSKKSPGEDSPSRNREVPLVLSRI